MIVFWTPLTLVQARGFVRYRVSYEPQSSQKRQEFSVVVSGDQDSVTISGLLSGVAYDVTVVPFNTELSGQELAGAPSNAVAPSKLAWCACKHCTTCTCICMGIASSVMALCEHAVYSIN